MADIAQLGFEIDSTQARTAARDLDKLTAAADKTERSAKKLSDASRDLLRDEKGRFISAADSAAKYGAEIDALRTKYNPLYAASKQFEAAQSEVKRALELGAITASQAEAALERLNAQMISTSSGGMSEFNNQSGNVFAQLNDIGVMMASGQNPLILAIQQGMQLNQVWADMGSRGRTLSGVASVLGQAFTSMINPMSLLTIGVIAGGAALVQWGMSAFGAAEETKTFDENVTALEQSVTRLQQITATYSVDGLEQLRQKYGEVTAEVMTLIARQREAAENAAIEKSRSAVVSLGQEYSALNSQVELFARTGRGDMAELTSQLGLSKSEVVALGRAYKDALSAKTADDMTSAMKRVNDILDKSSIKASDLALRALDAESAMRQLSAIDVSDNISRAATAAWDFASGLWDAAKAKAAVTNAAPLSDDRQQAILENRAGVQDARAIRLQRTQSSWLNGSGGGRSGGGGGGGGASDQYASNLQQLIESLNIEQETVDAWYQSSQKILEDRRAAEILGTQTHNEAKLLLEQEYQARIAAMKQQEAENTLGHYNTLFGNMADIAKAGGDKATGIVKAFSIAQGLINSYLAYTQVLADPSLVGRPFLRTALAASTLAAGLAQVANMKSGGGGSSGSAASSATSASSQEPIRTTRVELIGDDWMTALVRDKIAPALYEATKDGGRVQFV